MSLNAMGGGGGGLPPGIDPKFIQADRDGAAVLLPMGITSENVAAKFGITRDEQVRPRQESEGEENTLATTQYLERGEINGCPRLVFLTGQFFFPSESFLRPKIAR